MVLDPALVSFSINQARKPDPVLKLPRGFLVFFSRSVTKCGGGGGNITGGSVVMTIYDYDIGDSSGNQIALNTHIGRNPVTEVAEVNYRPVGPTASGSSSRHWYIEYSREGSSPLDAFEVPGNGDVFYNVPLIYNYRLVDGAICDSVSGRPALVGPFDGPGQNPVGVGRSLPNPLNDFNRIGRWFGYPFSRTLPLFDSTNVMKHVLMTMPVMGDNAATSQSLETAIGPNSNFMALVDLPPQGLSGGVPDPIFETRISLPAYTFTAMSIGPMTDGGNTMTPESTEFATDIPLSVFPPSISRIELVFVEGRVAIRLFTSTHIYSQFFSGGSLRIYQYDCRAFVTETPLVEFTQLSCPQCSELPIRDYVDVFVESGQQVDLTLSVCAYVSYLDNEFLVAARPVCMAYVGECASGGGSVYFDFETWVRIDLFSFLLLFDNPVDQPLQLVATDKFQVFCDSVSIGDQYTATVRPDNNPNAIRLTLLSVCPGTVRIEGPELAAVQATSSVSNTFNVTLDDPVAGLAPSSVVARTDGFLFLQFNQTISLVLSPTNTLLFECSSGTVGKSLSVIAQGSLLIVEHTPCSSYFGDSTVLVKLVSYNLGFVNGQRSLGWTGFATKQFVASITSTSCSADVTTVYLTTSMWQFTADSVRMICPGVTINATIVTERPFGFLFVNPRPTYGLTCRAEFTLYFGIGLDAYQTLTTQPFEVCLPASTLAPIGMLYYPGVREMFIEYLPAGQIIPTSVIPSQFVFTCGNGTVNATLSFLWATGRVIALRATNCPANTGGFNYTLRAKTGAFLTTSNDSIATNVTTIPDLQVDVVYQRTECFTNAQNHSQNLVYVSGEWDVVSGPVLTSTCNVVSQSVSESFFTLTTTEFKYTPCTADVVLVSPGPRNWTVVLKFGNCVQWDWKEGLLFGYLFAENQDKSKTVAQTQQLNLVNDAAGLGLMEMDWMTDAVRYRSDSAGVENFARNTPSPEPIRILNAVTRGDFSRILGANGNVPIGNYTFAVWMSLAKTGIQGSYATLLYNDAPMMGISYGPVPSFNAKYERSYVTECSSFGSNFWQAYNGEMYYSSLGLSVIAFPTGVGWIQSASGGYGLTLNDENEIFMRVRPAWRYTSSGCNCIGLTASFVENLGNQVTFSGLPPSPWYDTTLAGTYQVGPDPFAKSPVVLAVVSLESDGTNNLAADTVYYDKSGARVFLPSGAENFFNFGPNNCTSPASPAVGRVGVCSGFGPTAKPFCAVGGSDQNLLSRFVLFPGKPVFTHMPSVYSIELYNRYMTRSEIDDLWTRGLPNSMPVVRTTALSTLEDQTISNLFSSLDLYDFDIVELDKTTQNLTIHSIRVTSGLGSVSPANNYSFIPVFCTFGNPYATLEVVASDGTDTSRPATVTVSVTHVNHAPLTANVSAKVRLLANTTVDLGGQDCDTAANDFVVGVALLAAPASGRVFDPNSGALVTVFPYNLTGSRFIYSPNETLTPQTQVDVFEFVTMPFLARDTLGAQSGVSYVTLNVSSNIQGGTPATARPFEDLPLVLPFTAGSDTDPGSVIEYLIVTLPRQGTLRYQGAEVTISQLPLRLHGPVTYLGCRDCWGPDSFQYLVESLNSSLQSARSTYPIDIQEVNDPPVLIGPDQTPLPQGYTQAPPDLRLRLTVNVSDVDSDRPSDPETGFRAGFRIELTMSRGAALGLAPDVKARLLVDPELIVFRGDPSEDENIRLSMQVPKRQIPGLLTNMSVICGETGAKVLGITVSDQPTADFTESNSARLDVSFECLDGTALFGTGGGTTLTSTLIILAWVALALLLGGCVFFMCIWPYCLKPYFRKEAIVAHKATGVASGRLSFLDIIRGKTQDKPTKARHSTQTEEEQSLLY